MRPCPEVAAWGLEKRKIGNNGHPSGRCDRCDNKKDNKKTDAAAFAGKALLMLNIGVIIAAGVLVIYLVLGPIVIMGFYAFFDRMAEKADDIETPGDASFADKDPALWSAADVRRYLEKHRRFRAGDSGGRR